MAMFELFGEEGRGAVDGETFPRRECDGNGTRSRQGERRRMDPETEDAVRGMRFLRRVSGRLNVHLPEPFLVRGRMGMEGGQNGERKDVRRQEKSRNRYVQRFVHTVLLVIYQ